ncbi:SRPBCC domain-containing protein [Flavobacteriaceae bacterium S356]|uniref:SRPBCC domain-containing protein n=1 Tax=Asprobacillus argus TaxID=3076534 RepID=A0ABU3LG26_9FLAO|nr:SRPBCC domain-containing protein [Flavobacteriaceae bacterium S356]
MKDVITKERVFKQPIDKVWNAISVGEEISAWFIKADFKAKKGYGYTFTASEEKGCVNITGEVKQSDPYTLSYTWIVDGTTAVTTVTWKLESVDDGTKLFLEHSGISNYEGETAVKMFENFSGGWMNCMDQLDNYVNTTVHAG